MRQSTLCNKILDLWNDLRTTVVESKTIITFRNKLDKYFKFSTDFKFAPLSHLFAFLLFPHLLSAFLISSTLKNGLESIPMVVYCFCSFIFLCKSFRRNISAPLLSARACWCYRSGGGGFQSWSWAGVCFGIASRWLMSVDQWWELTALLL